VKLNGKVVVVTGAGSGLGREVALELLRRGATVAAVDRSPDGLAETSRRAGEGAPMSTHVADVTDRARVAALPADVAARHGVVDGVIHCAGIIQPFVKLADLDDAVIERVLDVNLYGTLYVIRAFLPGLLARPEAHVVTVSSMGGFLPVPGQTVYGASKAAVKLLTEGLYAELADTRVRVTAVFPGAVATDIVKNSGVDVPQGADAAKGPAPYPADRAARDLLDGVERDAYHVFVGKDAKMMDALVRVAPERANRFIARKMKTLLDR
jgi:NAD(P)-dependent dehydrogenase (short-subunit alcohol dehydrogenase family)